MVLVVQLALPIGVNAGSLSPSVLRRVLRMTWHFPEDFQPDFAKGHGLVAAIAQDHLSGEVLMLAWMNEEAWEKTLQTGEVHYFSRSRQCLWHKGASSGHVQKVRAIRLDCDSDAVLLRIEQVGNVACHEGYRSCFYREFSEGTLSICAPLLDPPAK